MRNRLVAASVAGSLLLAAGCSKAPAPPDTTPSVGPTSAPATSPAPSSDDTTTATAPTTTTTMTTGAVSTTSSATPTASASPSAPATTVGTAECKKPNLNIVVQRGSGAEGHQYAAVVFTKTGAGTCSMTGFPGIQLLLAGKPLGKPAVRSSKPVTTITLATGQSASAMLQNNSTCNADNSDQVQVIVPDDTQKTDLPLRFRGCAVTVDPVRRF
jgi:hypothetical protein